MVDVHYMYNNFKKELMYNVYTIQDKIKILKSDLIEPVIPKLLDDYKFDIQKELDINFNTLYLNNINLKIIKNLLIKIENKKLLNLKVKQFFYNMVIYELESYMLKCKIYLQINNSINKLNKDRLDHLKLLSLSKKDFLKVITYINKDIEYTLLLEGKASLGSGNGSLGIVLKNPKHGKNAVNWGESNKQKSYLIQQGLTCFKQSNKELALINNEKYNAKKWLIYNTELNIPYVIWNKPYPSLKLTFKVNRNDNVIYRKKQNIPNNITDIENNLEIGIAKKLKYITAIDPQYKYKYSNYDL
jgi:hypothetical protein